MDDATTDEYRSPDGDLGQDIDFDLDDDEYDENGDLLRILGIAGGVAAAVGGLIILLGRKRETPAERMIAGVQSTAKDVRKAVENADLGGLLGDALDQANRRVRAMDVGDLARDARHTGRDIARGAQRAVGQVDLESAMDEIRQRLATIEREGRRGGSRARKEAQRAFGDLNLDSLPDDVSQQLGDLWEEVGRRAKDIGWAAAIDDAGQEVRRLSRQARRSGRQVDVSGLRDVLEGLRGRLADTGVQSTLEDEVLPEARKRARQAGDALGAAAGEARKRGGALADEYGPQVKQQAGKTAEGARGLAAQVTDLLRVVAMEALDRMLSDVLPGARKGGERVAETVRDDTLPWLRHRAGEVRDRVTDDVAPKVRDAAAEAPGRVRDAAGVAGPAVADTLSSAADALGEAVARMRPKVGDAVESGRNKAGAAAQAGSSGVGGALSNVGRKAGDAVSTTVDTTKYVTGETGRILFWLSMLTGLILMIFVPDAEKQKEIWNNVQQFLGELRTMWSDFSSDEFASDTTGSSDYTGDAGV